MTDKKSSGLVQNLILSCFGGLLGLGVLFAVKPLIGELLAPDRGGMEFESLEDFHRVMLERDQRDEKGGESVSLRSIITPHPNDSIMFDLLPNLDVNFQKKPTRTNQCGMRGADLPIEKPEGVIRVLFLGDSFTFGWGVNEEESFPAVTERVLNRFLSDESERVEVLNMGVPGYSTFQEVELFLEKGLDFQPDIVVVFFVENDFGLPFFIRSVAGDGAIMSSSRFAEIGVGNPESAELEEEQRRVARMLDPSRSLRKLVRKGRRNGYKVYLAFNPHPNWKSSLKRLWYPRKSKEIQLIKPRERFLAAMEEFDLEAKDLSLPDDPHPSAVKHALLGALIAESLFPSVTKLKSVS